MDFVVANLQQIFFFMLKLFSLQNFLYRYV